AGRMMDPPPPPDHHFAPVNPDMHILDDEFDIIHEEPVRYEERRPNVQQRMSAMSIHDDSPESRTRGEPKKSSEVLPDFVYYRLRKSGDDWGAASKSRIVAPIEDIEKTARKGKGGDGPILNQMKRMSDLRRDMIDEIVYSANKKETGDRRFEVAYITSKKIKKRSGKIEVPEMDLILARTRAKPRGRGKSVNEEIIKVKESKGSSDKQKKHDVDGYGRSRKDSVLEPLEDPIANLPLFEHDGRPRDELGPIHFNNAGLPPQIPEEKPLGAKAESKKEDKKRDKSRKRSKSRGKHYAEDDIVMVGDVEEFYDAEDAPLVDGMFAEVSTDKRGRRGKSPYPTEHPEVLGGEQLRRSHSRRRPPTDSRGHSRDKSRSRRGSVYIPNQQTQEYFNESSASSQASDSSHFGFVEYAESSGTSLTSGGVPRRGSLVRHEPRPETVYKTHHRGPVRSASYAEKSYRDDERVVIPARSRRESFVAYQQERPPAEVRYERAPPPRLVRQMTTPIPEERQVLYHQEVVPARRMADAAPVIRYVRDPVVPPMAGFPEEERAVMYYHDDLERRSSRVEDYQRERVKEEYYKQREQELHARERDLELAEADMRRSRIQERGYYDDGESRGGRRASKQLYYDEETGRYFYYE
ncbi:hypothetical protein LTR55_010078, partial [Exophiala xenobiotica]